MLKKIFLLFVFLLNSSWVMADVLSLNADRPKEYIVQKGDTLWDIAGRFLSEPWRWPEIFKVNPQIEDPHWIYPGDVVSLIFEDGKPVLVVNAEPDNDVDTEEVAVEVVEEDRRAVKLSPRIRVHERDEKGKVQSIPLTAIKHLFAEVHVIIEGDMIDLPYVVAGDEKRSLIATNERLYVRGLDKAGTRTRYSLYRQGPAYTNPNKDPEKILGYEVIYVGDVVLEKTGDPASFILTSQRQEVLPGDRLAAKFGQELQGDFVPSTPEHDIQANILAVINGVKNIGQYDTVVVDAGKNDGIEVGNILAVYRHGQVTKDEVMTEIKRNREERIIVEHEDKSAFNKELSDFINGLRSLKKDFDKSALVAYMGAPDAQHERVELPPRYIGVLMVFRVFEGLSYALVMKVISPINVLDSVSNL